MLNVFSNFVIVAVGVRKGTGVMNSTIETLCRHTGLGYRRSQGSMAPQLEQS